MRQLLMLGFYCEVYRREPLCRVYVNDVLIDEFNIPHTPIKKDLLPPNVRLDPAFWAQEQYQLQSDPPFLKFIEFDDADQRSIDFRVEIKNDDNNYTNGFMTRHTRIMLCQCWLAPVKVWEQFEQIRNRWRFSRPTWQKYFGYKKFIDYYLGYRNVVLDNLAAYAYMHFPNITQRARSKEQLKIFFNNYQDLPPWWQESPKKHWVGSSGYFHLTLAKKLGFWRHSKDQRRGWWGLSWINNMKDLYDKYKQYENK